MTTPAHTRRLLAAPLVLLLSLGASCPPAEMTDPQTRAAFHADRAVTQLGELQATAIALNEQGLIADNEAVTIVRFVLFAVRTVQATPYGWFAAVDTAWTNVKLHAPAAPGSALEASYATIDLLLELVRSGGGL